MSAPRRFFQGQGHRLDGGPIRANRPGRSFKDRLQSTWNWMKANPYKTGCIIAAIGVAAFFTGGLAALPAFIPAMAQIGAVGGTIAAGFAASYFIGRAAQSFSARHYPPQKAQLVGYAIGIGLMTSFYFMSPYIMSAIASIPPVAVIAGMAVVGASLIAIVGSAIGWTIETIRNRSNRNNLQHHAIPQQSQAERLAPLMSLDNTSVTKMAEIAPVSTSNHSSRLYTGIKPIIANQEPSQPQDVAAVITLTN